MSYNDWEPELTPEQLAKIEEKREVSRTSIRDYMRTRDFKRLYELRLKYAELRELKALEQKLEWFLNNNKSYLESDDEVLKQTRMGL